MLEFVYLVQFMSWRECTKIKCLKMFRNLHRHHWSSPPTSIFAGFLIWFWRGRECPYDTTHWQQRWWQLLVSWLDFGCTVRVKTLLQRELQQPLSSSPPQTRSYYFNSATQPQTTEEHSLSPPPFTETMPGELKYVLRFKKLTKNAFSPSKGSKLAAGFDLCRYVRMIRLSWKLHVCLTMHVGRGVAGTPP